MEDTVELLSKLFIQPVYIVILVLLCLELVGLLLHPRPFKQTNTWKTLLKSIRRWDVIAGVLWIGLAALALWDLHNAAPIRYAFLVTGTVAFLAGWWIRHCAAFFATIAGWRKGWRRLHFSLDKVPKTFVTGNVRHPFRLGAWLEILGVATAAMSLPAFVIALILFPIVLRRALVMHERSINEATLQRMRSLTPRGLIPHLPDALRLISVPVAIGFLAGICSREFVIFRGGVESARSLLTMSTQVEGTLGVLAITIVFVLTQVTAAAFSVRISANLLKRSSFWVTMSVLLFVLTYNILLISKLDAFFPLELTRIDLLWIDLSLVLGAFAAFTIAYFIWGAPKLISPEAIIDYELKRFNAGWMDNVRRDWQPEVRQVRIHLEQDPFVMIERTLVKSVETGDHMSFSAGLARIERHLHELLRYRSDTVNGRLVEIPKNPADILALDRYLHYHLLGVIVALVRQPQQHLVKSLFAFVETLGVPSADTLKAIKLARWMQGPPGEILLRAIIESALEHRLTEYLPRAFYIISERSEIMLKAIPRAEETWMYNPNREDINLSALPRAESDKFIEADHKVEFFQHLYLDYLSEQTSKAIRQGLAEIAHSVSGDLCEVLYHVNELTAGEVKRFLIGWGLYRLYSASETACEKRLPGAIGLGFTLLQSLVEKLDRNTEKDLAALVEQYTRDIMLDHAKAGILDMMMVTDIGMLCIEFTLRFVEQAEDLILAMGQAATHVRVQPDFSKNRYQQYTYGELASRIKQQSTIVGSGDATKIRAAIATALKNFDDPK